MRGILRGKAADDLGGAIRGAFVDQDQRFPSLEGLRLHRLQRADDKHFELKTGMMTGKIQNILRASRL